MATHDSGQNAKTFTSIEHPTISLPKGGGAIRGIGEKFQANPATGSGSFSIPLPVSPGRGNFQPDLNLSYDSGAGNSSFGLGWNCGAPSIRRKTDKELPQYRDAAESDTYILAGAEDLVPVLEKRGTEWVRVEHEKIETDRGKVYSYFVYPYRPGIEGLFARIERWVEKTTRETHWRVTTKENITSIYGKNENARITDPHNDSRIFEWLIEKSFDAKGNAIAFIYKQETNENIPVRLSEQQRVHNGTGFANHYLKRVYYTPFAGNPDRYHFQLVFDYGEHTADTPEEVEPWPSRLDPFSVYKAGFEIRSYRLCRRVLMFHNFPKQESDTWELVKSLEIVYRESEILTYLLSAALAGHKKTGTGHETKRMPPIEFRYTEPETGMTIQHIDSESLKNLPAGLDDREYQWTDLAGEGSPGILTRQGGVIYYKENLGNGRFGAMRPVYTPTALAPDKTLQISDLDGDGVNELVIHDQVLNGYYRYTENTWKPFVPFKKNPVIDWSDPNLKMIDLTGDGHPDIVISEHQAFRYYPSKGAEGYDASVRVPLPESELKGPRIVFSDPTQSIYLADMSGDGLTDIVRIRNGEVCYWPNLGYGTFGPKVSMDSAPRFTADTNKFNQRYIKLGDIDGSGTTDIMYLGNGTPKIYFNKSGNSWSEAVNLTTFMPVDALSSVSMIDLLGKGTMCLVWSTQRPGMREKQMSYVDLMGIKPHLLTEVKDNMGSVIKLSYIPSTKFYHEDKAAGTPWITKLSFPIHCLERVETIDEISGSKLVTTYRYHHGYFDGKEREFRGFGMVEVLDTESFEEYAVTSASSALSSISPQKNGEKNDPTHYVAPVLTKTWYHTGAFIEAGKISKHYEHEYYQGDEKAFLLPDTVIEDAGSMNATELREAYRALKGSALRQEIYEAGVAAPYQVKEASFAVRKLSPLNQSGEVKGITPKHGVFFAHAHEAITFHYEKINTDPRISHELATEVDDFGNVKKNVQVVYPRRSAEGIFPEQSKAYATLTVKEYINETTDFYRLGLPVEETVYELGKEMPADAYTQFSMDGVTAFVNAALSNIIMPESDFSGTMPQARIVTQAWQYFWDDAQNSALPFGQTTAKALVHHTDTAALTPGLVERAYGNTITNGMLASAGYVLHDGIFYNPGLIQKYDTGYFYLPIRTEDPFGGYIQLTYDIYRMFPVKTEDALGNTSTALMDYRTLAPWKLIDANGNVSEAIADPMGMVMATSVYGSEDNQPKGDMPLFDEAGNAIYQILSDATASDVLANSDKYLQNATSYFYYDLDSWKRDKKPPHFVELARETHVRDLAQGETPRIRKTIGFSDGFEREIQSKIQVEPGLAWVRQPDSTFKEEHTSDRWLVSGRTVYNNKQKPVKQYEPFYSAKADYEDEEFFAAYGVTPILHYDPLLRIVRTDTPKGFLSKVEFTPWEVRTFDENDTVKDSEYYTRFNQLSQEEQEALTKAGAHYNTPKITRLDTLGREFMRIENKMDAAHLNDANRAGNELITYTEFTITGKPRTIADPRQFAAGAGIKNFIYTYDMADQIIRTQHIDGADDRVVWNVLTNPVISFDAKGHELYISYDVLQRPVKKKVTGNGLTNTIEVLIYGEGITASKERNLRGKLYQHYDQAGLTTFLLYSFKGELKKQSRKLRLNYKEEADWADSADWNSLQSDEIFYTDTQYNAVGQTVEVKNPDGSVTRNEYHVSGTLDTVRTQLKGENAFTEFVSGIVYNPKGQREKITYGNGTETLYDYEKTTFRLTNLKTRRLADNKVLQNIAYTYDPVGNITLINDASIATVFNNNQMVEPKQKYVYDALYRLIEATGREHAALNNPDYYKDPNAFKQSAFIDLVNVNDANKLANYTRRYSYDNAGNLLKIQHIAANSQRSFTREIAVDEKSNRWLPINMGEDLTFDDHYDANGNISGLEHLQELTWNYRDNISSAVLLKRVNGINDAEYYVYDSSGQRVRKVRETLTNSGNNTIEVEEKIYLGSVEIKRIQTVRRNNSTTIVDRTTLHVMDDKKRIAVVHNWSQDSNNREVNRSADVNTNKTRYQFGNHLDSASLELDTTGNIISYEEYFPYGDSSFVAGTNQKEVKLKEYRYTGKEKDEATGLYYFGARYYASWVGRWLSCDPLFRENPVVYEKDKVKDEDDKNKIENLNLYGYCRSNPIILKDSSGHLPILAAMAVGAAIGVALDVTMQVAVGTLLEGKTLKESFMTLDKGSIALSAASGAVGAGIVSKAAKFVGLATKVAAKFGPKLAPLLEKGIAAIPKVAPLVTKYTNLAYGSYQAGKKEYNKSGSLLSAITAGGMHIGLSLGLGKGANKMLDKLDRYHIGWSSVTDLITKAGKRLRIDSLTRKIWNVINESGSEHVGMAIKKSIGTGSRLLTMDRVRDTISNFETKAIKTINNVSNSIMEFSKKLFVNPVQPGLTKP